MNNKENEKLIKGARAFNRLNGIENTSKNVKNTKSILKDFVTMEENKKYNKYVTLDELKKCENLKEIKEKYDCYYIKVDDKDVFVDVKKIPAKHNKFRYSAIGANFIELLENNTIATEETL